MRRLPLLVLFALVALFLVTAAAAPVGAAPPTVPVTFTLHFTGPGVGTFTTEPAASEGGVICATGTWIDDSLKGSGSGDPIINYHVIKVLTCPGGSTIKMLLQVNQDASISQGVFESGSWTVLGGTGVYARLRGGGSEIGGNLDGVLTNINWGRVNLG